MAMTDSDLGPSADDIARRRKLADAMVQGSLDSSPVQHWTQALARGVQGGLGALLNNQANSDEQRRRIALADVLAGTQGGGMASAAPMGGAGPATAPAATPAVPGSAPAGGPRTTRQALLDAIAGGEAPAYDTLYGGGRAASLQDHPRTAVPITSGPMAGKTSSAAGRYQFLAPTWDAEARKLGLKDFSPESQDTAAWDLAATTYKNKTGRDLEGDLKAGRTDDVARALSGVWPSLPGGNQPNRATGAFDQRLQGGLLPKGALAFNGEPSSLNMPPMPAGAGGGGQAQPAVATAPQQPQPAGQPQAAGGVPQVPPEIRQQARRLAMLGMEGEAVKLLQEYIKPPQYGFQTLADGTIVRTDPRTGNVTPVFQAPVKPTFTQIGEDPVTSAKQYGFVDPIKQQITPAGGAQGGTSGDDGMPGGLLAPGVGKINSELAGDDYLKQFSPELQASVKAYVNGESTPTGNPRKGFTQAVKMIAQKYGSDIGMPADETTFGARRQMRTQLSSAAPSSLGGQINVGNTAIGHLADLSQKALELGNVNFGGPLVSHAINAVRGMASTEQAAKLEGLKAAAQHYGQEVTKFYSGSPGGVAERDRFMDAISGAKTPQELAAVIATEAELMHSRLSSLEDQIKGTLGERGTTQYPVIRPGSQKALEVIEGNISRLRGGNKAAQPQEDLRKKYGLD